MKTHIITLVAALMFCLNVFSQNTAPNTSNTLIYSFLVNSAPNGFNVPLIGFVNMGRGSHQSTHIGFINTVRNNFTGGQVAFVNYAGGNAKGAQIGFINTALQNTKGLQLGFINTTGKQCMGSQIGFINTVAKKTSAIQVGFVNTCADTLTGAQIGFVNTAIKKTDALQLAFVNSAKTLKGTQIGFINYVDSLESGVPLGLLSIVRKGGYHALELSVSEMYPVNLSYKIGISQLYTTFILSYNPANEKSIAIGAGLGSLIPLNNKICFNPEFLSQSAIFDDYQQMSSFAANIAYCFTPHLSVSAGPSLVWQYGNQNTVLNKPFFAISKTLLAKNRGNLYLGARVAVRYKF